MFRIFAWLVPVGLLLVGTTGCPDTNDQPVEDRPPQDTTMPGDGTGDPHTDGVRSAPPATTPDRDPAVGTEPADDIEPLEDRGDDAP